MLKFAQVGIAGYAGAYTGALDVVEKEGLGKLVAAVVRTPTKYPDKVAQLEAKGVRIFPSLETMLKEARDTFGAIGLPTGIQDHCPQAEACLDAGLDVVLEKPPAAVVQDVRAMIEARDRNRRKLAVGFQSQSGKLMQGLKNLILKGRLGKIREVAVLGPWSRAESYYARNQWAGRMKLEGRWTLDGPMMNALAHQLMNALYLCGPEPHRAASVTEVVGECYHGHKIETEDLTTLRAKTDAGATVYYAVTHCWKGNDPIQIEVVGEKGVARCDARQKAEITFKNGKTETIATDDNPVAELFRNAIAVFTGKEEEINCPLEMAMQHTLAANCAYLSSGGFHTVPEKFLVIETDAKGETLTRIEGINDWLTRAFRERKLLSEMDLPWAVPGKPILAADVTEFGLPD